MGEPAVGLLTGLLSAIVLLLMSAASAGGDHTRSGGRITLSHGLGFRITSVIFLASGCGVMVPTIVDAATDGVGENMLLGSAFAAISFVPGWIMRLMAKRVVVVDDGSISQFCDAQLRATIDWSDVVSIEFSGMSECFTFQGRGGQRIRVSRYVGGLPQLWSVVARRVPRERWRKIRVWVEQ
jgi:hypothetical protein